MQLSPKQQRFVEEFLIDLNATQATIRAGYSAKSARDIGCENLTKPNIQDAIQKAQAERSQRTQITADRVLEEYARIGFSNIKHYITWKDHSIIVIASDDISEDDAACISAVSQTITETGSRIKFKLHDKIGALDSLARHLGINNGSIAVKVDTENASKMIHELLELAAIGKTSLGDRPLTQATVML